MNRSIPPFFVGCVTLVTTLCLSVVALGAENRWESAIAEFEKQDQEHPPTPGGVMFLGSSSIRLWDLKRSFPGRELVNRGFGGSEISDSVHYFDRIVLPHQPRLIVSYMGGNDIAAGKLPETVVADFQKFVKKLHEKLPETRLVYISIKLCKSRWANREKIREANRHIQAICEQDPLLDFIDIDPVTLDENGQPREDLYLKDQLHFNEKGYDRLNELVEPFLKKNDTEAEKKE